MRTLLSLLLCTVAVFVNAQSVDTFSALQFIRMAENAKSGNIPLTLEYYNRAARMAGTYVFSPEFTAHINSIFAGTEK